MKTLLLRYHLGEENQMKNPKKQIDWKEKSVEMKEGIMRFLMTIKEKEKLASYGSLLAYRESRIRRTWAWDYLMTMTDDDDDDVTWIEEQKDDNDIDTVWFCEIKCLLV